MSENDAKNSKEKSNQGTLPKEGLTEQGSKEFYFGGLKKNKVSSLGVFASSSLDE